MFRKGKIKKMCKRVTIMVMVSAMVFTNGTFVNLSVAEAKYAIKKIVENSELTLKEAIPNTQSESNVASSVANIVSTNDLAHEDYTYTASGICGDDIEWTYDDGTKQLTIFGTGEMYSYTTTNNYYTGITTDVPWGNYLSSITTVKIEGGVTSIGNSAFSDCTSLDDIELPSSLLKIGESAFARCMSLGTIHIPDGVIEIGEGAFAGCTKIMKINIPDGVTALEQSTFTGCSKLETIILSENLVSIGAFVFNSCSSLEEIVLPNKLKSIGNSTFFSCKSLKEIEIPKSVETISLQAFYNCCNLSKVTICNDEIRIGKDVFKGCSSNLILYGNRDSEAEIYASSNNIVFKCLNPEDTELYIKSFQIDKESGQKIGEQITLTVKVSGGTVPYQYMFYYMKDNGKEETIVEYSNNASTNFRFLDSGNYQFGVRVKDGKENVVEKKITSFKVHGFQNFAGGDGTKENPYQIADGIMFREMGNRPDANYILISDIDLTDYNRVDEFNGTFDGKGYTITTTYSKERGMFNTLSQDAVIKNCIVNIGYNTNTEISFGAVAIDNYGEITNCTSKGIVYSTESDVAYTIEDFFHIGGICATNYGEIKKCRNDINITINQLLSPAGCYIGGIVGVGGNCIQCMNTGNLKIGVSKDIWPPTYDSVFIGGIMGQGNPEECANIGNVELSYNSTLFDFCGFYGGIIEGTEFAPTSYETQCQSNANCFISDDSIFSVSCIWAGSGGGINDKKYSFEASEISDVQIKTRQEILDWWNRLLEVEVSEITASLKSPQDYHQSVTFCVEALGGKLPYSYKFSYKLNEEVLISDFSSSNSITFMPDEAGEYEIIAYVRDATGKVAKKSITYSFSGDMELDGQLQCSSKCEVDVDETDELPVYAFANSQNELKKYISSVEWAIKDSTIASVSHTGFIMPLEAKKYQKEEGGVLESWQAMDTVMIKGLKQGKTQLCGKVNGDIVIIVDVTVSEGASLNGSHNANTGNSVTLGKDATVSSDSSDNADFYPTDWKLSGAVLPIEISNEDNGDGTYTLKGTIGIGKTDLLDDTTEWTRWKKNVDDCKKALEKLQKMNEFAEVWDSILVTSMFKSSGFKKTPEVKIAGYIEVKYDKNKNIISQTSGIVGDAEWKASTTWYYVTPIGPIYLNLNGEVKFEANLGVEYNLMQDKFSLTGEAALTPSIALEGGYGIDKLASISAEGKFEMPIHLLPKSEAYWQAKASVHLKLLFVIDATMASKDSNKHYIYGEKDINKQNIKSIQGSTWNLKKMDTSQLQNTDRWTGSTDYDRVSEIKDTQKVNNFSLSLKKISNLDKNANTLQANNTMTENILLDGLLESSLPMQVQIDGKRVMIFQSYDSTRTTLNSSVLMYSVYQNSTWSEPKAVWDNGNADFYADMKVVNGELVLVWMKENTSIKGSIDNEKSSLFSDMAKSSEICFAHFDSNSNCFTDQMYVTENSSCDMMPQIVEQSKTVQLVWVRNDANSLMQEEGINTFYTAKWDGTAFGTENVLQDSVGTVDRFVAYEQDEGGLNIIYVSQTNGIVAVFDKYGQALPALSDVVQNKEEGTISSLQYVDGNVEMIAEGTLYCYNINTDSVTKHQAGSENFGSQVQYCSNGTKSAYLWSMYNMESDTATLLASMKTENGYSEPIIVYETTGAIYRYLAPVIDENGIWNIVANRYDTAKKKSSLTSIVKRCDPMLKIGNVSIEESMTEYGKTAVDIIAENSSDTKIKEIQIQIKLKDETVITKTVNVEIQPGEIYIGTVYVDLSDVAISQDATVSIYADGQKNLTEAVIEEKLGKTDLSVSGKVSETDENVIIKADIKNEGKKATDYQISLYQEETKKNCLETQSGLLLKAGESTTVTFEIPKTKLSYNENNAIYFTLELNAGVGDSWEDNNSCYIVLYQEDSLDDDLIDTITPSAGVATIQPTELPVSTKMPTATETSKEHMATERPSVFPTTEIVKKGTKKVIGNNIYEVTDSSKKTVSFNGLRKKAGKVVIIPATVVIEGKTYKVTAIREKALNGNKNITTVVIGNNVVSIGAKFLYKCTKLTNITIPSKVKKIGDQAFSGCSKLKKITIKTTKLTAKNIGSKVFKGIASKAVIKVPKSKKKVYKNVLKKMGIGNKVKVI